MGDRRCANSEIGGLGVRRLENSEIWEVRDWRVQRSEIWDIGEFGDEGNRRSSQILISEMKEFRDEEDRR